MRANRLFEVVLAAFEEMPQKDPQEAGSSNLERVLLQLENVVLRPPGLRVCWMEMAIKLSPISRLLEFRIRLGA